MRETKNIWCNLSSLGTKINWMISIFLLSLNIAVNVTFLPNAFIKAKGPDNNCQKQPS